MQADATGRISFPTLGYGIYEIASVATPLERRETASAQIVFEPGSGFKNLIVDNWLDDEAKPPLEEIAPTGGLRPSAPPLALAFEDSDMERGEIQGLLSLTPPSSASDVESFVVYWSTSSGERASLITELPYTGTGHHQHSFAENTPVPSSTQGLIAYSKNRHGLSEKGTRLIFLDKGRPEAQVLALAFNDQDPDSQELGGTLSLTKAASEENIGGYRIYWGDAQNSKVETEALVSLNAQGTDLSHDLPINTPIPAGAVRFLVFTTNDYGEAVEPLSFLFDDRVGCANPLHTGELCDSCLPQFDQATFPACNACANTWLAPGCNACVFPQADFHQLCVACINPARTPPRCQR